MRTNSDSEFNLRKLEWFVNKIGVRCKLMIRRVGSKALQEVTVIDNPIDNETSAKLYHYHYKSMGMEVGVLDMNSLNDGVKE